MTGGPVEAASVRLHGHLVGNLWSSKGMHQFQLAPEYRELPRRPVLGQVFEEQPNHRWKQAQHLPKWFSNLLPEQRLRDLIAEEREISPRNEFRLLFALGADLPGAIEVVPLRDQEAPSGVGEGISTNVAPRNIVEREKHGDDAKYLFHFSLAGVQLKLSMVWSANTLLLPGRGDLGDHLVKLPSRHYDGVPENEFSMMTWARETGIDVPDCDIRPADQLGPLPPGCDVLGDKNVYVVRRFDRAGDNPHGRRIHMEDLNQVVDNWPENKYRGASFERLGRIILTLCGYDDFVEYIRRLTFCIGIGNEDAHLKNWAIWYPNGIQPRLSPAYDLVSTVQYLDLDRKMALKLGRTRQASRIDLITMERVTKGTDVDPAQIKLTVQQTLESMCDTWPRVSPDLPVGKSFHDRLRDYQRSIPLVRPFAI